MDNLDFTNPAVRAALEAKLKAAAAAPPRQASSVSNDNVNNDDNVNHEESQPDPSTGLSDDEEDAELEFETERVEYADLDDDLESAGEHSYDLEDGSLLPLSQQARRHLEVTPPHPIRLQLSITNNTKPKVVVHTRTTFMTMMPNEQREWDEGGKISRPRVHGASGKLMKITATIFKRKLHLTEIDWHDYRRDGRDIIADKKVVSRTIRYLITKGIPANDKTLITWSSVEESLRTACEAELTLKHPVLARCDGNWGQKFIFQTGLYHRSDVIRSKAKNQPQEGTTPALGVTAGTLLQPASVATGLERDTNTRQADTVGASRSAARRPATPGKSNSARSVARATKATTLAAARLDTERTPGRSNAVMSLTPTPTPGGSSKAVRSPDITDSVAAAMPRSRFEEIFANMVQEWLATNGAALQADRDSSDRATQEAQQEEARSGD